MEIGRTGTWEASSPEWPREGRQVASAHTAKAACWLSALVQLQPSTPTPESWLNQGVSAAPQGRHHSSERSGSICFHGWWELSGPKGLAAEAWHPGHPPPPPTVHAPRCPPPARHRDQALETHRPTCLKARRWPPTLLQKGPAPLLLHPGEGSATGDPWCSLAGHAVLFFK